MTPLRWASRGERGPITLTESQITSAIRTAYVLESHVKEAKFTRAYDKWTALLEGHASGYRAALEDLGIEVSER